MLDKGRIHAEKIQIDREMKITSANGNNMEKTGYNIKNKL